MEPLSVEFLKYLGKFVTTEHPYAPKLSAYCVGGGASLALLSAIPGSGRYISGIRVFSDRDTVSAEIDEMLGSRAAKMYLDKAVQLRTALYLANMACRKNPDGVGVGVTAALTTTHYRKDNAHAYIAFTENDYKIATVYHVIWPEISELEHADNKLSRRQLEDEQISRLILSIVYGFENDFFDRMKEDGMVKELQL